MRRPSISADLWLLAGVLVLSQAGCMSALTSTSLRDALLGAVDSLADVSADGLPLADADADVSASLASDDPPAGIDDDPQPTLSLDDAVDLAVARLKSAGELDPATQAALLSILESTNPEDWPAAIDAFAASLENHRPIRRSNAAVTVAAHAPAIDPPTDPPAEPPTSPVVTDPPATEVAPPAPAAVADAPRTEPARLAVVEAARPVVPDPPPPPDRQPSPLASALAQPATEAGEPLAIEPSPATDRPPSPSLAVRNSCFVSRVRAWGVVDRFPEAVFRPGQEVIVYFELEAPAARPAAAGQTTSVDTAFRLVGPDGSQLARWDFEPIEETCDASRRDYFARYFLRIPDGIPPGLHRLEFVVSDLVAGTSMPAHLDLEVR